jgi:glyoxylase-like metal-dependent hydrolase (beta-lactamase superfamily II)
VSITIDIISIGTLSHNPFWNEQGAARAAHATTTLVRDGSRTILVDPSLPPELLIHRLSERTGLVPGNIDIVFLTNFLPVHRRGLQLFDNADWLIGPEERRTVAEYLNQVLEEVGGGEGENVSDPIEVEQELALLGQTEPAPDKLTPGVHLFPSPGATAGSAGLLITGLKTMVIAGDAVLTRAHYEHGRVYERSADAARARESFADIAEIADIIVPGHDNLFVV